MEGRVTEVQSAAFLIALRTKGETVDEVAGLASTMRELALRVTVGRPDLVDTAGTGGGGPRLHRSATPAPFAAPARGPLAEHRQPSGNRGRGGPPRPRGARGPHAP